jgi:aldehyde dehydrogenase (NAD+)
MPAVFTYQFDSSLFKGTVNVNTGLFINGQFVDSVDGATFEYVAKLLGSHGRFPDVCLVFLTR